MQTNKPEDIWKCYALDKKINCWVFRSINNSTGYGEFMFNYNRVLAHRLAYELKKGPIPAGLQIDHLCRNRACINPDHLEAVTRKENLRRGESFSGVNARKTHCVRGHPFSEKNTWVGKSNKRICRICQAAKRRKYYLKTYVNDSKKRHEDYLRQKAKHR